MHNEKVVRDLVQAICAGTTPFTLPRPCGAFVAPHAYRWEKSIAMDEIAFPSKKMAFVLTNDPNQILQVGTPVGATETVAPGTYADYPGVGTSYITGAAKYYCSEDLVLEDGRKLKSTTLDQPGYIYSASNFKFMPSARYYPCVIGAAADPQPEYVFKNPSNRAGTLIAVLGYVDLAGIPHDVVTVGPTAFSDGTQSAPFSALAVPYATWLAAVRDVNTSKGFYIYYVLDFTSSTYETAGNAIGFKVSEFALETLFSWFTYSLWQLIGNADVAKKQFETAQRYNVTANTLLFQNLTSLLNKGGAIYAARFPGNSFGTLPHALDELQAKISSQVHHCLEGAQLELGLNYFFTPEKLQDWLFERDVSKDPYSGDPENIPYLVVVVDASNTGTGGIPTFNFLGRCHLEYLTDDVSNYFFSTPGSGPVFDALTTELAKMNGISPNETHIEHIKNTVSRVMSSDNVKYVIKSMAHAGIKLAPFVLSALGALV
jgi:hypothetical protein